MKIPHLSVLLLPMAMAFSSLGSSQTVTYSVNFSGDQESPPVVTPASGSATVTLDLMTQQLTVNGTFSGLVDPQTAAHLHGAAGLGSNAGVLETLTITGDTNGTISGTFTLSAGDFTSVMSGLTYLNIHSTTNPAGELRGQIVQILDTGLAAEFLTDPVLTDSGGTVGVGPRIADASEPFNFTIDCTGATAPGFFFASITPMQLGSPILTKFGFFHGAGMPFITFSGPHIMNLQSISAADILLPNDTALVGISYVAQGFCSKFASGTGRSTNAIIQTVGI